MTKRKMVGMTIPTVFLLTLGLLMVPAAGCGYHFPRRGYEIPKHIKRLAIPTFLNRTAEPEAEAVLTDALRVEMTKAGFATVTDTQDADAIVMGILDIFEAAPISFGVTDFAVEYRIRMVVHIKIRDGENHVLWEDPAVDRVIEYMASPDIFISEQNRRTAVRQLAREMMRDITARIFDGFDQK
jgi:outer membrane lipopolysaccharide assembly protein LptE/RlpB